MNGPELTGSMLKEDTANLTCSGKVIKI